MEIICINDKFPDKLLEIYRKHGVITPKMDKIYSIREVLQNVIGPKGFRLVEIVNPEIPAMHPMFGLIQREPDWSIHRFATLLGEPITEDMLRELIKEVNRPLVTNIEPEFLAGAQ